MKKKVGQFHFRHGAPEFCVFRQHYTRSSFLDPLRMRLQQWKILMNPTKTPLVKEEIAWSKRLESVRKDVECFFGILKGRFRILKLPVLYRKREDVDNVFFTCCILHNMLHAYDGLDVLEADVDWAGADGRHDPWERHPLEDASRLSGVSAGAGERVEIEAGHALLKRQLVTHFSYRAKHKQLCWFRS